MPIRDSAPVSRRAAIAGATACLAMQSQRASARVRSATSPASVTGTPVFSKDSESIGAIRYREIHHGKGTGKVKFFGFSGMPAPAHFIIYDLPPGTSEGVHVHYLDNRNAEGSYDEYYYIVSGQGQMEIDGKLIPVAAGDHVHTPLEVSHGIENTHETEHLKVFLTFIKRGEEAETVRRAAAERS